MTNRRRGLIVLGAVAIVVVAIAPGAVRRLVATHGAVACYTSLIAAANRADLDGVRQLCTGRYLSAHEVRASAEGGVVDLPRQIHPNFGAWVEGRDVWLCPTNRVGPVYRFVRGPAGWMFDGLAGVILRDGRFVEGDGRLD